MNIQFAKITSMILVVLFAHSALAAGLGQGDCFIEESIVSKNENMQEYPSVYFLSIVGENEIFEVQQIFKFDDAISGSREFSLSQARIAGMALHNSGKCARLGEASDEGISFK